MTHTTEKHLFRDAGELFEYKHDTFLEMYLGETIMGGDAINHTPINEITFIYSDKLTKLESLRILNALSNSRPLIYVEHDCIEDSNVSFEIHYINNFEDIENFYCIKKNYDFTVEGIMLCQILEVKIQSLNLLNEFWITHE